MEWNVERVHAETLSAVIARGAFLWQVIPTRAAWGVSKTWGSLLAGLGLISLTDA